MIFDARHKLIPLPETPKVSRADADTMFSAGLTLTEWEALSDGERADIRWKVKHGATA